MDIISDSDSEGAGSIPAGVTRYFRVQAGIPAVSLNAFVRFRWGNFRFLFPNNAVSGDFYN